MKRRTEITVETDEIVVVRRSATAAVTRWCTACAGTVTVITPEEAAAVLSTTPRMIYRLIEAGGIHHDQTSDGLVVICTVSLAQLPVRTE
jgi:excisionase family DNA binding protein